MPPGDEWAITIAWNGMAPDAERYGHDFAALFQTLGWKVATRRNIGGPPDEGTVLNVLDAANLSASEGAVKRALEAATIEFQLRALNSRASPSIVIGYPTEA